MSARWMTFCIAAAMFSMSACSSDDSDDGQAGTSGEGGAAGDGTGGVSGDGDGDGDADVDAGGTGGSAPGADSLCESAEAFEPLEPRADEQCYELVMHDGDGSSPFMVPLDETYNQFYFEIPWGEDQVATRFGQVLDNGGVLHHWLGFETEVGEPGSIRRGVIGTTIGESAKLFGGWAVGGCNVEMPPDVGLELAGPSSGKVLMIQWHHYNFTGEPQPDNTKIQICTVPREARQHIGSVTWLGTESLGGSVFGGGMPPGVESKFSGTCLNETEEEINIVAFLPHMHNIGKHMYTEVLRKDGTVEPVFDKPFQFDFQVHYDLDPFVKLQPGDKIRAECTYFNNTSAPVGYGQSSTQEMCYQFAFAYPAGALEKPNNFSLIGATNTCWGD